MVLHISIAIQISSFGAHEESHGVLGSIDHRGIEGALLLCPADGILSSSHRVVPLDGFRLVRLYAMLSVKTCFEGIEVEKQGVGLRQRRADARAVRHFFALNVEGVHVGTVNSMMVDNLR